VDKLPIILSLDTASMGGSVVVARGAEPLATRTGNPQLSHSNTLLSDINKSLLEAGLELAEVDVFACASGPGSFTGLRIGLATVKSLGATLSRPCVGIPTLAAVAHGAGPSQSTVAIIPAGRGELFAQLFTISSDGVVEAVDKAAHLSPQKLVEKYAGVAQIVWAGDGVEVQREFLTNYARQQGISLRENVEDLPDGERVWTFAPKISNLAREVGTLALQMFFDGKLQTPTDLRAIYVRPSDAELNQQCL
jgi:tRNA threonylcarbamoyladenosine biosynthesis protein TsaB